MKDFTTPEYIKSLAYPQAKTPKSRKVWSIDLETVLLPFFTATNTMGDTVFSVTADAIGAPIRLAYDTDGAVRFSKSGKPVTRVAKPISENVALMRQNVVASLVNYAENVQASRQKEYAKQVQMAQEAGKPILAHDKAELDKAIALQVEEAMREAERQGQQAEAEAETIPEKEAELAPVS